MADRNQSMVASWVNILAGIWLIISPFVLQYTLSAPRTNDIILGIIVGVVALVRVFTLFESAWLNWINGAAGVWLIIAQFVLGYGTGRVAGYNEVILGIIVGALALWNYGASHGHRHAHA